MRRRAVAVAGLLALLVSGVLLGTSSTMAAWTDEATLRSGSFDAATIRPPAGLACDSGRLASGSVQMTWSYPDAADVRGFELVAVKTSGHAAGTVLHRREIPAGERSAILSRVDIPEATWRDSGLILHLYFYRVEVVAVHESGWISSVVSRGGQQRQNNSVGHYCS